MRVMQSPNLDKTKVVDILYGVLEKSEYLFQEEEKVKLAEFIQVVEGIRMYKDVLKQRNNRGAWHNFLSKYTGLQPITVAYCISILIKIGILIETEPDKGKLVMEAMQNKIPNAPELFETAKKVYSRFPARLKLKRGMVTVVEPNPNKTKELDGWNRHIREYVKQKKGIEITDGVSDETHVKNLNELKDQRTGKLVKATLGALKLSTFRTKLAKLIKYGYFISYKKS